MSPCAGALLPIHAGATVLCRCFRTPFECVASLLVLFVITLFRSGGFDNPAFVPLTHQTVKTFVNRLVLTLSAGVSLSINKYVNLS
jgi:hypothetical protein